jgi:cytochrome c
MKRTLTILAALALTMSMTAMAEDGAALYKKCAGCHGAAAEGKSAPALKGNTDVVDIVTKGGAKGPHAKPMAGVSADQAKAIADYIAGLK